MTPTISGDGTKTRAYLIGGQRMLLTTRKRTVAINKREVFFLTKNIDQKRFLSRFERFTPRDLNDEISQSVSLVRGIDRNPLDAFAISKSHFTPCRVGHQLVG